MVRRNAGRGLTLASAALLVAASAVVGAVVEPSAAYGAGAAASVLEPIVPCRLVDTRPADAPLGPASVHTVPVAGRCGVSGGATAVALQVTVVRSVGRGYVSVVPSGTGPTGTSTTNWSTDGQTVAGATIVGIGRNGAVDVHVVGTTHLVVDVTASFTPAETATAGRFVATRPTRVVDTRRPGGAPWAAGEARLVDLGASVPADATAVVVNVTTAASPGRGHFSARPPGAPPTETSVLNTDGPGQTRAASTVVAVRDAGFVLDASAGGHVIVDLFGYFTGPSASSSADGLFVPLVPVRAHDTRLVESTVLFDGGSQHVDTTAVSGPVAATVGTVTLVRTSARTHATLFAADGVLPETSNVNADGPGGVVANLFVVETSSAGLFVRVERETHVVVDVTGVFTGRPVPPAEQPFRLSNVDPGPDCHGTGGRAAIVDRVAQRLWLCRDGVAVSGELPFTAGPIEDAPRGEYRVFFKRDPWWGAGYTLRWFTAFTLGDRGGRVAFHRYVAMREDDVGTEAYRNASHGCFRLRTADALLVWGFLMWGDTVLVINDG